MSSNYVNLDDHEDLHVDEDEPDEIEVRCPAHCRNGVVEVRGQETDCITCEGMGTIMIPA